jgi:Protein of unknown function (DUF1236)
MTTRFMMSVAAATLIAGTGFANAQGTGMSRDAPSAGSTVQQNAPSSERGGSSATPTNRDAAEPKAPLSGMKATQSDDKSPAAGKTQRTEDNMPGQKSKSMSSESNQGGSKDMKTEGREGRGGNMNAEQKGAADSKSQTTGQAGAGAKLTSEQRTKITTVIKNQHVAPVTSANFSISVGARVPREVSFHPLPVEIVTIYPEWRGYEFFLVRDQIVVVDPRTLEIVAVLEA